MQRRNFLSFTTGILCLPSISGCTPKPPVLDPNVPLVSPIVDIHCHVFNGSDLPTVRFIKIVMLSHYPKQGTRVLDIRDPDALDGLLALLTAIVGRTRAPKAEEEIAVLRRESSAKSQNLQSKDNERAVIGATAKFLAENEFAVSNEFSPNAFKTIRRALISASSGKAGAAVDDGPLSPEDANVVAERAYRSKFDLGRVLRWFGLFTRYRYSLSEQLWIEHANQGFPPKLLCPAAIDYDMWLGENVDASPLPRQVAVMGQVARRKTGPVVHGYVGFDPLRQVYFDEGKGGGFDPIALVRQALLNEGFLGVKLYPPMGFRSWGNFDAKCQTYPKFVLDDLFPAPGDDSSTGNCKPRPSDGSTTLGQRIDRAMGRLFDLCTELSACVIAHSNNSNGSGPDYGLRADPAYWIPAFRQWPALRVCLAHFGHFQEPSAGAPAGTPMPAGSWEWALGRFFKSSPDAPVFADISYLSELFEGDGAARQRYAGHMKAWISEFDPDCHHLMFGTDWTMLGIEEAYEQGYTKSVHTFFKEAVGLDQPRLDRLFFRNAARFLGMREGDGARKRLLGFYESNGIPRSRFPELA